MHPSQLLSAIVLVASAGLVTANPVPDPLPELFKDLTSRLVARNESKTEPEPNRCVKTPVSQDYEHSYYTFHIEAGVKERANRYGLTKIGVVQYCESNGGFLGVNGLGTENWAFAPLVKFGSEDPYKIQVKRCKKRYDRRVARYQVWLCNEKEECGTTRCGLVRKVCPERKTKSVDLVDDASWICSL